MNTVHGRGVDARHTVSSRLYVSHSDNMYPVSNPFFLSVRIPLIVAENSIFCLRTLDCYSALLIYFDRLKRIAHLPNKGHIQSDDNSSYNMQTRKFIFLAPPYGWNLIDIWMQTCRKAGKKLKEPPTVLSLKRGANRNDVASHPMSKNKSSRLVSKHKRLVHICPLSIS
jgi:hypothetical protein